MKKRILTLLLALALLAGLTVPALAAGVSVRCISPTDDLDVVQVYGDAPVVQFEVTKPIGSVVEGTQVEIYDMDGNLLSVSRGSAAPESWLEKTTATFNLELAKTSPALSYNTIYSCVAEVTVDGTAYHSGNLFFMARQTAPTYTVNFMLDLDTMTDLGTFRETNGQDWVLPDEPTRPGKTFVGWKLLSGEMIDPDAPVMLSGDNMAYGVFERDGSAVSSEGQAPDASGMAYASTQKVDVDGRQVTFQMYALRDSSGNDTNYVKLRDVAFALTGTDARFNVEWSAQRGIYVTPGLAYIMVGGEMDTPFSGDRPYTRMNDTTDIDGEAVALQAFTLTDDAGNGYTYYKLRDLGQALGFHVGWSAEQGVYIETGTR